MLDHPGASPLATHFHRSTAEKPITQAAADPSFWDTVCMFRSVRCLAVALLACPTDTFLHAQAASASQSSPMPLARYPTAVETETLCWINAFRAEPRTFANFIVREARPSNAAGVDWAVFEQELAKATAAPPVFFEARLATAARAHARYMVDAKEYGHHETTGQTGFTGEWPHDRARATGYTGDVAECSIARGVNPLETIAGYVVDAAVPGTGTHGMQERRGHRVCLLRPKWRDVGVGNHEWGRSEQSNVLVFGVGDEGFRVSGGVVFDDLDGDGRYDVGEGIGGVHVAIGRLSTLTSASGAWRLDLPVNLKQTRPVLSLGSLRITPPVPSATHERTRDAWFEVVLPVRARIAEIERAIEAVGDAEAAETRSSRIELLELRPPRRDSNVEVELADAIATAKRAVLDCIGKDTRGALVARCAEASSHFRATEVETWLARARDLDALTRRAAKMLTRKPSQSSKNAFLADLAKLQSETRSADLWIRIEDLGSQFR
ncbi:MAG: hypothetical protein KDC95_15580 [Planctomycetes bacterium]|nr:hypothetical protein [Planctomycetota bacterium]